MGYTVKTRDQHLAKDGAPKRILALDGGGLRAFSASRCCRGSRTPCGNGMASTPSFACVTTST